MNQYIDPLHRSLYTSRKEALNQETLLLVNLHDLFLSSGNINMLIDRLISEYDFSYADATRLKSLAISFAKSEDLNQYATAEQYATGNTDYIILLRTINNRFIQIIAQQKSAKSDRSFISANIDGKKKKGIDLTPQDYILLDFASPPNINLSNARLRNNNAIPFYEASIGRRHYDYSSESMQTSKETFTRTYDMSPIYNSTTAYKSPSNYKIL